MKLVVGQNPLFTRLTLPNDRRPIRPGGLQMPIETIL